MSSTTVISNVNVFDGTSERLIENVDVLWFTPAEILKQATANNAELLSWSGPRNPYPGRLGVIEPGAYADLLLVQGDPLADLELFDQPEKNLALIMKDGKIYKNTLR